MWIRRRARPCHRDTSTRTAGRLAGRRAVLRGQVKRLEGYGVFVALPPPHNMDGLVHVSRIHPDGARLNDAGDVAQFAPVGAEVYVFVQGYKDGGKLELSVARSTRRRGSSSRRRRGRRRCRATAWSTPTRRRTAWSTPTRRWRSSLAASIHRGAFAAIASAI